MARLAEWSDELMAIAGRYGAEVLRNGTVIVKYAGEPSKVEELVNELSRFRITHISRTGITAVVKEDGKDILRFGR